jgi:hypothetical protein
MWGQQTYYTIRRIDRFVPAFVEGNAILYVGTAGPEDTSRLLISLKIGSESSCESSNPEDIKGATRSFI